MDILKLKKELERDEGRRNKAYQDSKGIWTVGVGHNLQYKPISDHAIDVILNDDVNDALNDLFKNFPWMRGLDEVRQRVFANMCFNMGVVTLSEFHNTLAAAKDGRYQDCAKAMLDSDWAKQVGSRADRLARMMETGQEE